MAGPAPASLLPPLLCGRASGERKEMRPLPASWPWTPRSHLAVAQAAALPLLTGLSGRVNPECVFPEAKAYSLKYAFCFSVQAQFVKIFLTDRSLAEKQVYLFNRSSKSGDSEAHVFVSSSPF
nr:uncharacterized protein LOC120966236 isoform X2 [Aegilops tauschii subsp. strangulata]